MSRQVRVPIRVRQADSKSDERRQESKRAVVESDPVVSEPRPVATEVTREPVSSRDQAVRSSTATEADERETLGEELATWRDRALRLQAEIENFRKRQRRLAQERIEADRGRLLRNFLTIGDDLERALEAGEGSDGALREGIEVTSRSLKQLLRQEGVEPIAAKGEQFDPEWHEAVGTVPHEEVGVGKDTVVDVTQRGYRLDGRLLRPARVIVAK